MRLRWLLLAGLLSLGQKCNVEKEVCGTGALVMQPDGVVRCVPREQPSEPAPTTTSTTTSTTTTTLPSPTPRPPTPMPIPSFAPTPAPCASDPAMPAELVSVVRASCPAPWIRVGSTCLAPSSCEQPGENSKCFIDQPNGATVPWVLNERSCWSYPTLKAAAGLGQVLILGGMAMLCGEGYPGSADDEKRGCSDAFGRRVKWDGSRWLEAPPDPPDRWSGWYHGHCPPRQETCEPTPAPMPTLPPSPDGCGLPAMPENAAPGDAAIGIYGGCRMVEKFPAWAGSSRFENQVEAVLSELIRERGTNVVTSEEQFTAEVAERLRAMGLCATTKAESPGGGSSDEIGVKDSNDRSEQFDIVLSNGRVRHGGYVAVCRPARF